MSRVIAHVDEAALVTLLAKKAIPTMISQGPGIAVNGFVYEAKKLAHHLFCSLSKLAFGMLRSSFFRQTLAAFADVRMSELINWRSYGIIDSLLSCYPRLLAISDGTLRSLVAESFDASLLLLNTVWFIAVWAPTQEILAAEVGSEITNRSLLDVDWIDGNSQSRFGDSSRQPGNSAGGSSPSSLWSAPTQSLHILPMGK
jgi:hypothetical protein